MRYEGRSLVGYLATRIRHSKESRVYITPIRATEPMGKVRPMPDRILVLYGSYRTDRMGIRLANFLVYNLRRRGADAELIDAKAVSLPIARSHVQGIRAGYGSTHHGSYRDQDQNGRRFRVRNRRI